MPHGLRQCSPILVISGYASIGDQPGSTKSRQMMRLRIPCWVLLVPVKQSPRKEFSGADSVKEESVGANLVEQIGIIQNALKESSLCLNDFD